MGDSVIAINKVFDLLYSGQVALRLPHSESAEDYFRFGSFHICKLV